MTFVYDEDGVYCALIDQNYQRKIPDLVDLPHFMIMGSVYYILNGEVRGIHRTLEYHTINYNTNLSIPGLLKVIECKVCELYVRMDSITCRSESGDISYNIDDAINIEVLGIFGTSNEILIYRRNNSWYIISFPDNIEKRLLLPENTKYMWMTGSQINRFTNDGKVYFDNSTIPANCRRLYKNGYILLDFTQYCVILHHDGKISMVFICVYDLVDGICESTSVFDMDIDESDTILMFTDKKDNTYFAKRNSMHAEQLIKFNGSLQPPKQIKSARNT